MLVLRSLRRGYAVLFSVSLLALCGLKLYVHQLKSRKYLKVINSYDPWTKKHWFRLTITDRKHEEKTRIILLWTKFFSHDYTLPTMAEMKCPVSDCMYTSNRSMLDKADAIFFHLRDMHLSDMPTMRHSYQRWVLVHHEAPPHTPTILKYFNKQFNWTVTYRRDSDVVLNPTYSKRSVPLNQTFNIASTKSKMAVWIVSNCNTPGNREGFVKELQKIIPVDVYGDCGTKKCYPKMSDKCIHRVAATYRYYLSFENSICKDYITEKFYQVVGKNIIPVVFGGANYSYFAPPKSYIAPPKSYIDALAFGSPESLGHFLLALAENDEKYNSYFEWRNYYRDEYLHYFCKVCEKLHFDNQTSYHKDLYHWWFENANCKTWSPIHETL